MSLFRADKITGRTGSSDSAPITLSGDTATITLGAGTIGTSVTDSATQSTSVTNNSTTNLQLTNCFSANYSVYEFYLASCEPAVTSGVNLQMRFLTSDGNASTSDMWHAMHDIYWDNNSNLHNVYLTEDTNGMLTPIHNVDSDMGRGAFVKGTIFNPFSSVDNTSGTMNAGWRTEIANQTSKWATRTTQFAQETLVSCTGLRFNWESGNWATGATNPVGKLIVKGVR